MAAPLAMRAARRGAARRRRRAGKAYERGPTPGAMSHITKIRRVTLARVRPPLYPRRPIVTTMRFLLDTSLWHPGAEATGSASPCGASRTGLRTPIIGLMGVRNHAYALARREMR